MSRVLRKVWKKEILSNLGHLLEGDKKNYDKSQSGFKRPPGSKPRPFESYTTNYDVKHYKHNYVSKVANE
jgi:hypothetical protein